jgi:hypothetical protein
MYSKEIKDICQDVIDQINVGKFYAMSGSLIGPSVITKLFNYTSGQEFIKENECYACAKGCLALSWILKNNEYSTEFIDEMDYDLNKHGRYPQELLNIFGRELLDMIEAAFESVVYSWNIKSDNVNKAAEKYGDNFVTGHAPELNDRLIRIMQDIIDDKF